MVLLNGILLHIKHTRCTRFPHIPEIPAGFDINVKMNKKWRIWNSSTIPTAMNIRVFCHFLIC